jgi:hypothetical protein
MARSTDVNAAGQGTDASCKQRNGEARGPERVIQNAFAGTQSGRCEFDSDRETNLARGEKERLAGFALFMKGIRQQAERMAAELRQNAAESTADVARGEKERLADCDLFRKTLRGEVDGVCKYTHELLERFGVERREMVYG